MIMVFVLLYGFYLYLKYLILKEEKQTRDFLYNLGFTTKRIDNSFNMTYIKNALILGTITFLLLEIGIEMLIKLHKYNMLIPITIYLILLLYVGAYIIEMVIPWSIQTLMNSQKSTIRDRINMLK